MGVYPSMFSSIGHCTVVGLVSWPLSGCEAEGPSFDTNLSPFLMEIMLKIRS